MFIKLFSLKDDKAQSLILPAMEPDIEEDYDYEDEIEDRHYLY